MVEQENKQEITINYDFNVDFITLLTNVLKTLFFT